VRRPLFVLALASITSIGAAGSACSAPSGGAPDAPDAPEHLGTSRAALTATDPVSAAVTAGCSTVSVKGLATQLVDEIQCLQPGSMKSIEGLPGLVLGEAVFPFLQTPAADALARAQTARGTSMRINSALRTLPQQYLLYRWYQTGKCGISLAAAPGKSNHETAVAVDIEDTQGWRSAMTGASFRWLGASDPVHFDYTGAGALDLRGVSVTAFQRLWNRNHPEDPIDEDGAYGGETEKRLARAPVGGFPRGAAGCAADAGIIVVPPLPAPDPEAVPDAQEPSGDLDSGGCAASPLGRAARTRAPFSAGTTASLLGAILLLTRARRERARRTSTARATHTR
jgi:hypothetical protein